MKGKHKQMDFFLSQKRVNVNTFFLIVNTCLVFFSKNTTQIFRPISNENMDSRRLYNEEGQSLYFSASTFQGG